MKIETDLSTLLFIQKMKSSIILSKRIYKLYDVLFTSYEYHPHIQISKTIQGLQLEMFLMKKYKDIIFSIF